jgi:hypothetical protein
MKTSKKLKPMKANVGKFLLSKALDPYLAGETVR